MCTIKDFTHLQIINGGDSSTNWRDFLNSELGDWHQGYLPTPEADLSGTGDVWDFGAGCGETAQFFLNHHADRVQCVEMNPLALKYLHLNFDRNPRVIIHEGRMGILKLDVERSEWKLRFEAHDAAPKIKVLRKFDRESNTGIYGIEHSPLATAMQDLASGLHMVRIGTAHWLRVRVLK